MTTSSNNVTFHRKPLPKYCTAFDSADGIRLFSEALRDGYMASYFPQASVFQTQLTPAYCGLASLAMTLNSLNVDPQRTWQGIWRW
jgi:glutathione gamma-glutamylcysteinyltransferase